MKQESLYKKVCNWIVNPSKIAVFLLTKTAKIWSDENYIRVLYRLRSGQKLNLKTPKTFNEKIQWLKLYDRRAEYTTMVDKYAVKEYVASKIGKDYIISTLGVWDRIEEIEWTKLPNQFVLKCTHDSGGLVICKDKMRLDKNAACDKLRKCLKRDYFYQNREWPYKDVPKKILAERYISPASGNNDLSDYKWYCFNGEPMYCQVIQDRSTKETIDFFDINWIHQDFIGMNPLAKNAKKTPFKPLKLDEQLSIARKLSKGIPFSRIDLYEVEGNVYFGEITFYPMSGMGTITPVEWNDKLGDLINIIIN